MLLRSLLLLAALLGTARADDGIANYAVVVGSNSGGPGQTDLRYSEDDARRVGALLTELAGYQADHVDIVVHPTPDVLRDRLAKLGERVNADLAAGKQSRIFFYYSGHARSTAIDLGSEQLPLMELRQRLFQVPATLTVVVLDACQSGAFSRVKGAQPAADFSFNSRQHLDAKGIAVLASSSGSELSQESEQLKSSYFTHHLLVGLRGAGDANRDGQVSLDEAYRYAYHQTLLATAETAVGGQHVSLEVDLRGHGEVPLSFPRAATSSIELPAALEGKTLVEDKRSHTVVAETYKAKGAPVRIAVAPGEYRIIVRHGRTLSRCDLADGGVIDLARCSEEAITDSTTKGGGLTRPTRIEIFGRAGLERRDAYTDTLEGFGYQQDLIPLSAGLDLAILHKVHRYFWLGGTGGYETHPEWHRDTDGLYPLRFSWSNMRVAAVGRGEISLWDIFNWPQWMYRHVDPVRFYGQLTVGVGMGRTLLRDQNNMAHGDRYFGPTLSAGAGVLLGGGDTNRLFKGFGLSMGYELEYSPIIENLLGDTHASGGHRLTLGASYSY